MDDAFRLRRTYRYAVYPTARQRLALEAQLHFACQLYNASLEQRRDVWRSKHRSIRYIDQCRDLTDVRAAGMGPPGMSCWAMRDPLRRLPGIGTLKVKWHRPLPSTSVVRTVTVRRRAGRWYAFFSLILKQDNPIPQRAGPEVGIDLGIKNFATLSTGEHLSGPRISLVISRRLRLAQRRLSRRKKGSKRRIKAGLLLARIHVRAQDARLDHAHKVARRLVKEFGFIAVEDLNIRGMTRGILRKHIYDQAWRTFLTMLSYKAEEAGTQLVRVAPRETSQACSGCGVKVPKPLSERMHECRGCGLVLDRDINAARNVLRLGLSHQASTWPTGACVA